jgi:hypothetical protein
MGAAALCGAGGDELSVSLYSQTHPWSALFDITIVRLD